MTMWEGMGKCTYGRDRNRVERSAVLYYPPMRKLLIGFLGIAALGGVLVVARATTASEVTVALRAIPATELIASDTDALVLDATIAASRGDILDALTVRQEGSAVWQRDVVAAKLWTDAGASGFQGIGVDRMLVSGVWHAETSGWSFSPIGEAITDTGTRFFVTVTTGQSPTNGMTVRLGIPGFRDAFAPMSYDTGDLGVFLRTARPAPAATVSTTARTVSVLGVDDRAPIARITEPSPGAVFAGRNWLLVRGVASDSGGSSPSRVRVGLNRVGQAITWVDAVPEVSGFATWEARFFELPNPQTFEIRVQAFDWVGNASTVSEPMTMELRNHAF